MTQHNTPQNTSNSPELLALFDRAKSQVLTQMSSPAAVHNLPSGASDLLAKLQNMAPGDRKSQPANSNALSPNELARMIDHTLLKSDATEAEILKVCSEARTHSFYSVCVNSVNVALAARALDGSRSLPISVVGFPLGAMCTEALAHEAHCAIKAGAREIDMVLDNGAIKSKDYARAFNAINEVVKASAPYPVKVILETSVLDDVQKMAGCILSRLAGAAFVKTSTGFNGGGATAQDVTLMRFAVGDAMGVKASGGVRTRQDAINMISAGANRIGASASIAITQSDGATQTVGGY